MKLLIIILSSLLLASCNPSKTTSKKAANPDTTFLALEAAVQRSSGNVYRYGFTLNEFLSVIAKTGATNEWIEDANGAWILKIVLDDKATNTSNEMTFVFKNIEGKAAVIRYIDNGNEVAPQNLGIVVDQILTPFEKMVQSNRK
jgi:hypothetical protein